MFAPSSIIPYTTRLRPERQTSRISLLRTAAALLFRRQELDQEADAALLSGRVLQMAEPTMSWVDGPRSPDTFQAETMHHVAKAVIAGYLHGAARWAEDTTGKILCGMDPSGNFPSATPISNLESIRSWHINNAPEVK